MDVQDTLEILSTMSLRSCSHNSLRNYFKISAEEIKTLREQLANGKRLLSEQMELTNERTKLCIELRAKVEVLEEALYKIHSLSHSHSDDGWIKEVQLHDGESCGQIVNEFDNEVLIAKIATKALATYDKLSEGSDDL